MSTPRKPLSGPRTLSKAARLVVLMDLDDRGLLDNLSYQKIARMFNEPGLNRSTIMRDLIELPKLREEIKKIYKHFQK